MQPQHWSGIHDACINCETTSVKHQGRGLCRHCYLKQWVEDHPEVTRLHKHQWYIRNGGKALSKSQREQRHFSGMRDSVLKRDGYKCTACGTTRTLCVHHKDMKGRGHSDPNNELKNLVTMCNSCHIRLHSETNNERKRAAYRLLPWGQLSGAKQCRDCGTTERKHEALGLCDPCWKRKWRKRRKQMTSNK